MGLLVIAATAGMAAELAALAAETFPLACPPSATAQDVADHIAENLSPSCFAGYLGDPARQVFAARHTGRLVGYTMLIGEPGPDRSVELSKMYVLPSRHGTGAGAALMRTAISWAAGTGARSVWLGVNQANERAQRFYRKHGFEVTGTRTFRLGAGSESDFVMTRPL